MKDADCLTTLKVCVTVLKVRARACEEGLTMLLGRKRWYAESVTLCVDDLTKGAKCLTWL